MRHPSLMLMLFFTTCIVQTTLHSQTLINSCNAEFLDSGGQTGNYLDNENTDWLICPDTLTEYLELEFTHVDIETALNHGIDSTGCKDILSIYDGMDEDAPLIGSFCGEESSSGKEAFIAGHTLNVGDKFKPTSKSGCFYITFQSDNLERRTGWHAEVTCCTPSLSDGLTDGIDLPLAKNGGNYFDLTVDHSCLRQGRLEMFTEFESTGTTCSTTGLTQPNQSFYAFETNDNGGFTEFSIEAVDSVGIIEMIVYGPVTLDSASYVGGVINDCVSGENPWSLFFNAGPNQTYILGIATELTGRSTFQTLPSTVALGGVLPIELESYTIEKRGREAHISWTTSSEINNNGYEIYRSTDTRSFIKIGWVDAKAENNEGYSYSFNDKIVDSGAYYYYIKQIDLNGAYSDFDILNVNFENDIQLLSYPNPSNGIVMLKTTNDDTNSSIINVYNSLGQLKHTSILNKSKSIDLSSLESDIYTIQITSQGKTTSHQHIIQK